MIKKSFIALVLFFISVSWIAAAEITIFFYNPDAAPTDPSILIKTSSDYFKKAGVQMKIQPVIDADVFSKLVKEGKAKVFIASSGLVKSLGDGFKEIMIPNGEDGSPTYKKIVMTKADFKGVPDLKGQNVGSTSLGPESLNFLNEYLFKSASYDLNNSKVIYVKKDLDALLAAKIGQIKAAIISEKNLSKIEKINPAAVAGIKKLLTSEPIPESPLCAANDVSAGDLDSLIKTFGDMENSPEGKEFLKTLGYSKWVAK
ncbi:MAG TPA: PhnD/SsuA/transferrin family substrate-binding protein [bacterium]|nr:PhnD/SsuA/transferrin family substrate-binding protein [bacterium]HPN31335.1 PhnD/SsuA/transferrin family substrate-binding protein [bacterium]